MCDNIRILERTPDTGSNDDLQKFGLGTAMRAARYHSTFPGYEPTPVAELSALSKRFGVESIRVKDESRRFGLNAFKALGASYAVGQFISKKLGMSENELSYQALTSEQTREKLGDITLITATDGNHGRGVAWTANRMRQKCVVYMPYGTAPERLENIRRLGADASIIDGTYDDAVRLAAKQAEENGWLLVQDTAWDGYTDIPDLIMQGYTTIGYEAGQQMETLPTHIFLQAGVGSMAAAMASLFTEMSEGIKVRPVITIVEPTRADCFYRTAQADDGSLHSVPGHLDTIMAGLACGTPSPTAWDILKKRAGFFAAIPDHAAADAMRVLGNPLDNDPRIVSGESGASAFGAALAVLKDQSLRDQLGITGKSRIFCISTEGDTDRENYRRIVWDGAYRS